MNRELLFHTSYQTDHKTPSLGFDCLVTHVEAASYGNAAGSLSVGTRERMSVILCVFFLFFFEKCELAASEQPDLPSHQHIMDPP